MPSKSSPAKVVAAHRKEQVLRLKCGGYRNSQIAQRLGVSETRVGQILKEELAKLAVSTAEHREQWRTVELAKLDQREAEIRSLMGLLTRSEIQTYLKCQERLDKIAQHRARLLHLEDKTTLVVPVPVQQADPLADLDLAAIAAQARQERQRLAALPRHEEAPAVQEVA